MEYSTVSIGEKSVVMSNEEKDNLINFLYQAYGSVNNIIDLPSTKGLKDSEGNKEVVNKVISVGIRKVNH